MLTVDWNPQGFGPEYLRCLNTCFPHWGDERVYRWCFERPMSGLKADQMILRLDGNVVAGSAVSYRTVGFPGGRTALAGIMTGSWTLPAARGQGCFARVIAESVNLAAQRGCAALLAFVTEDNPSYRQLQKTGSLLMPGYYLFSDNDTPTPAGVSEIHPAGPGGLDAVSRGLDAARASHVRFVYPNGPEFSSQFLERPTPTELQQTADGALGLVEKGADTDRLQLLLPACGCGPHLKTVLAGFLGHSLAQHRKLFLYSTLESVRDACLSLGMRVKNGYLTMLPAEPQAWKETFGQWQVQAGGAAWGWNLESGDRI